MSFFYRLAHDISPDNYPDEDSDLESEFKREQFILECLAQAKQRTESANELENHKEKATCEVEKISEKLFQFSKKRNNFEQLNNEINSKCHGIPKNNNTDVHVYNIYETVKKVSLFSPLYRYIHCDTIRLKQGGMRWDLCLSLYLCKFDLGGLVI